MTSFESLGLDSWILSNLKSLQIKKPTPVQEQCIPVILHGHNCIGIASTGTGKTAAFTLPMLQNWLRDPFGIYGVILTPTRELALQITEQLLAFGSSANIKVETIVGGFDIIKQTLALASRPHFVVATPGRLGDIIRFNDAEMRECFKRIKFVILDEADRLLESSFQIDLNDCMRIFPGPNDRQTLLFTATLTSDLLALSENSKQKRQTKLIEVYDKIPILPPKLQEHFILTPYGIREAYLYEILSYQNFQDKLIIIFVNKQATAESLTNMLKYLGIRCTCIHGKQSQRERLNSLGRFRAHVVKIFIGTDVLSRGLDIPAVNLVINYDVPKNPDDYIHRVGRTARANFSGRTITLVTQRDVELIKAIEMRTSSQMQQFEDFQIDTSVSDSLNKVSVAKREAINLMVGQGFFEKKKKSATKRSFT